MNLTASAFLAALALAAPLAARAQEAADPYRWLEDIDSAKSMAWVEGQNARSAGRLEQDPRYATFHAEARAIFTAEDRVALPNFRGEAIENLWQDDAHVHGLLRRTSLASYRTADPAWDVLLDLDQLSKQEGKNWFYKGASCLTPAEVRCLVRLSDGGGDAVEVREFDAGAKRFVADGFHLPSGKQTVDWIDRDHIVAASPWTPQEVTASGYPFVIKMLRRHGRAEELFRGDAKDVSAIPIVLHGPSGVARGLIVQRSLDFFRSEYFLRTARGFTKIPLPLKADYEAFVGDRVVFQLKEPWRQFKAGAVISYDLLELHITASEPAPIPVFQPGPRQAIQSIAATREQLVIQLLDDVKGAVDIWTPQTTRWTVKRLPLPRDAALDIQDTAQADDRAFFTVQGFLEPTSLWLADVGSGKVEQLKSLPARFDASRDVVEQFQATSSDGTKVPYFVVRPKAAALDGELPTVMFGYGGFEVAETPAYRPELGKLWLERGGAYVVANIRGGGEFGPAWHEAALREHRQLAFDDFAAVAKDLFARKITSPRRLGIYGRSNGGVLMSVSMTQHPELWNAVVIESPLIDMLRYSHLSAGASWVGEYGDPDIAGDRAFIARYSGYQNLKAGVKYPEPYITTNTRDDRVHPGHARKFAARLAELGAPYLYYEQTFGGHANDADPELNARRWARHYVYLAEMLMDQ
jgi:prolyl oligopeptidase